MEKKTYIEQLKDQYNDLTNVMNMITEPIAETKNIDGNNEERIINIWENSKYFLLDIEAEITEESIDAKHNEHGILGIISRILRQISKDHDLRNCELIKQLKRAADTIDCLEDVIENFHYNWKCKELIGELFCLIVKIILELLSILAKIIVLLIFCKDCYASCKKEDQIEFSFCECLICDLEKELDYFETLIDELADLNIKFAKCSIKKCHHKHIDDECDCGCHDSCHCKHEHDGCCRE